MNPVIALPVLGQTEINLCSQNFTINLSTIKIKKISGWKIFISSGTLRKKYAVTCMTIESLSQFTSAKILNFFTQ